MTKIAEEVIAVALITENKELLPGYTSGAHVDLFSPTGVKRSYSLTESSLNTDRAAIRYRRGTFTYKPWWIGGMTI